MNCIFKTTFTNYSCDFYSGSTKDETYSLNITPLKCIDKTPDIKKIPSKIEFNFFKNYNNSLIEVNFYTTNKPTSETTFILSVTIYTETDIGNLLVRGPSDYKNFNTTVINNAFLSSNWDKNNYLQFVFSQDKLEILLNGILKQTTTLPNDLANLFTSIKYFDFRAYDTYSLILTNILTGSKISLNPVPYNIFRNNCNNCPTDKSLIMSMKEIAVYSIDDQPTMPCPDGKKKSGLKCVEVCEVSKLSILDKKPQECVDKCPDGFFFSSSSCSNKCSDNCKICKNSFSCEICEDGYHYSENKCVKTVENCILYNNQERKCKDCNPSFFYDSINNTCNKCIDNCIKCLNDSTCENCSQNNKITNDKKCEIFCLANCNFCQGQLCKECKSGFTPVNGSQNSILECISDQKCQAYDENHICQNCKLGFFLEKKSKNCISCSIHDLKCTSCQEDKCESCMNPISVSTKYQVINGKCKCVSNCQNCKEGCKNCEDGECLDLPCPSFCKNCDGYGKCSECQENYLLETVSNTCKINKLCKKITEGKCEECYNNFTPFGANCNCENIQDGDFCCNQNVDGCLKDNLKYLEKINKNDCICAKCELGYFKYNYKCLNFGKLKDKDCYFIDKNNGIVDDLPGHKCLKSIELLNLEYNHNCLISPKFDLSLIDINKMYFIFSLNYNKIFNYHGYSYVSQDDFYCNNNIISINFIGLNVNNSFGTSFKKIIEFNNANFNFQNFKDFINSIKLKKISKNSSLINSINSRSRYLKENLENKSNFFSDLISVYVNDYFKDINFKEIPEIFEYAKKSKNILVDVIDEKIYNSTICTRFIKEYDFQIASFDSLQGSCYFCSKLDFFFDNSTNKCFTSFVKNKQTRENLKIILYAITIFIIFLILLLLFICCKSGKAFENDESDEDENPEKINDSKNIKDNQKIDNGFNNLKQIPENQENLEKNIKEIENTSLKRKDDEKKENQIEKNDKEEEISKFKKFFRKYKKRDFKEIIISLISLNDVIMDLGYLLFSIYANIETRNIMICVFCFHPLFYFLSGTYLYIINGKKINKSFISHLLFYFIFIPIFLLGCITNLIGNNIDFINVNPILKYSGYEFQKLQFLQRMKLKFYIKTADLFCEIIPELIFKSYINTVSNRWDLFNITCFLMTLLNFITACIFLLGEKVKINERELKEMLKLKSNNIELMKISEQNDNNNNNNNNNNRRPEFIREDDLKQPPIEENDENKIYFIPSEEEKLNNCKIEEYKEREKERDIEREKEEKCVNSNEIEKKL